MSTHNIGFYEDLTKIIFQFLSNISSKTHLISSSVKDYNQAKWMPGLIDTLLYPPQNVVLGRYTVFSLSAILSFRDHFFKGFAL